MGEKKIQKDSDTPVSKEMKEQQIAGERGVAGSEGQGSKQPPQGSGRVHDAGPPPEKRRFEEGRRPSEQGDGSPKPRHLAEDSAQQGIGQRSGSRGAKGERGDTEATEE